MKPSKDHDKLIRILEGYHGPMGHDAVIAALADPASPQRRAYKQLAAIYARSREAFTPETEPPHFVVVSGLGASFAAATGKRVLIKPNLVSAEEYPETSDLSTIATMIANAAPYAKEIAIGDGPSLFFDSAPAIERVRQRFPECRVHDFNQSAYACCASPSWRLLQGVEVPQEIFGYDVLVNLCNFKTHNSFGFSGAAKNLMGLVSPATRLMMHRLAPDERGHAVEELAGIFMPQLVVMDARETMRYAQQRRYGGETAPGPGLIIDNDPIRIDRYMTSGGVRDG